jgi:hypothetical protein
MLVNKPLLLTTGALLFGTLSFSAPEHASADVRVRVGGGITVRTHPRTYYRPAYRPAYRTYYRPNYAIGGSIWVGGGTYYGGYRTYVAPSPVPACECGPGAVPSYYPGYYSQPGYANTATTVASNESAELPRLAIGGYAGGYDVDGQSGNDVGFLVRLRLTDGLLVEGELGQSELEEQYGDPDSRVGASLIYEIGARNTWAPYLVGGGGATRSNTTDESLSFGELGVGLRWALTDHLHLAFDIRAGSQERSESYDLTDGAAARVIRPSSDEETQEYTRGRLSAMLYF